MTETAVSPRANTPAHTPPNTPKPLGLQLRGVQKSFGAIKVVHGLDLDIGVGEFVVLLGESGCGKSTTLRMIAGLESVTAGQILIGERDVTQAAPMHRDIAMVFQNYALYPHMDVAQNMGFALSLAGVADAEIARRVNEAARILSIEHLLQRKPKELSGGQRQRVAIGRAIVREPSVFLFDEPLSNLDAKLRAQMRTELSLLHERLGKTTVYVTHDQVEAMTLASRIVIFDKGHIQQVGTPHEVFNQPANLFVAGFIGSPSMNLLKGQVHQTANGQRFIANGFECPLPPNITPATQEVKEWVAGIRPQNWRMANDEAIDSNNAGQLELRVDVIEYLGTESVLVGQAAGSSSSSLRLTAQLPGQRHDLLHQTVRLHVNPHDVHWFDADSGLRLSH